MKRRRFLETIGRISAAGLATQPVLFGSAERRATGRKPNIVFILADDLGYGDLGCYGQKRIHTPAIDRLAADGMRFTQFYAGSTVCAPSRCVLMTGLNTGHCRVRGNAGQTNPQAQALRPGDTTIATALKRAGYATALVGKWGLGDTGPADTGLPRRQGFDYFFGYLNQRHAHNYYPTFLYRNEEKVPLGNVVPNEDAQGAGMASVRNEYSADRIADEALAFIRRAKDGPFFLYFAPTLPHANNEAKNQGMEAPDRGEYAGMDWPEAQKGHAAMIGHLDRSVGRVLALLKELGLDGKTVVFFSSDNGPHREGGNDPDFNDSNGPLRGIKRDLTDGGIRVPFIARWTGTITPGTASAQVGYFGDLMATCCGLAGVNPPDGLDGFSLLPALEGRPALQLQRHEVLYWEFHEGGFSQAVLLDGRWKGIRKLRRTNPIEVYDLQDDLGESTDVAGTHPDIVKRIAGFMVSARSESPDWPVRDLP